MSDSREDPSGHIVPLGRIGPSDRARFGWPGANEAEVSTAATHIARHLALAGRRVIGFLPADRGLEPAERLAPMLARLGGALLGFVPGPVALVDAWRTWPWGEAAAMGEAPTHRIWTIAPGLLGLAPAPCGDAPAAAIALREALAACPPDLAFVLVNLAGYATGGTVPAAAELADGIVLVAAARRTRQAGLAELAAILPTGRAMGVVLVG